jgi:putative radical SAM enzyme (TIGR03279 family)
VSAPVISEVAEDSPAARAGLAVGDSLVSVNGIVPLDVIEYQQLVDGAVVELVVHRPRSPVDRRVRIEKTEGEPLGLRVDSAVFDRIRTCDNHCEFCFIYQLPKGLRRSLYLKDDDYRLSFLYGNFTTLTRFTELDAERVITERLSPLYVSIHATDPEVRAQMLRNRRGATSLRWLDVLLEAGIEVHGQVVVCPDVNDGGILEETLLDCLDRFGALASVAVVPLGLSKYSTEPAMRPHSLEEARAALDLVEAISDAGSRLRGRRAIFASDEYYLMADRPLRPLDYYQDIDQLENGIGMAAQFIDEATSSDPSGAQRHTGFFQAVDGAPPWGYRAERSALSSSRSSEAPTLLSGELGAPILRSALAKMGRSEIEVVAVANEFFGGTTGVTGLMTATDVSRTIIERGETRRWVLPDICLNEGRFLDGAGIEDLPVEVEVVATTGTALRQLVDQVTLSSVRPR